MEGIVGFCAARANTGKTTLVLRLLAELNARGVSAAVLKHGRHLDTGAEKDSARSAEAGAAAALFVAPEGWVLEARPEAEPEPAAAAALLRRATGCRVILAEGYKRERFPKVALCRSGVSLELPCPEEELSAVVCDVPLETKLPQYRYEDIAGLCELVLRLAGV